MVNCKIITLKPEGRTGKITTSVTWESDLQEKEKDSSGGYRSKERSDHFTGLAGAAYGSMMEKLRFLMPAQL